MRRTKEWWSMLTKGEQTVLVELEYQANRIRSGYAYLPVGYSDCGFCSYPTSGSICVECSKSLARIINKAERMLIRKRAIQLMQDIQHMGIVPPRRKQAVKIVRRLMCPWNERRGRWDRVAGDNVTVTYHPLKPASELICFGEVTT